MAKFNKLEATHELKLANQYWHAIESGQKTAEVRFNDRDFQKGDTIHFVAQEELIEGSCPKMIVSPFDWAFEITHVLHAPEYLQEGYCVLSIKPLRK